MNDFSRLHECYEYIEFKMLNPLYQIMTCFSYASLPPGSLILDHPLHGKIHQQIEDIQVKQQRTCLSNDWKM